ncbi:hypothetical protein [Legionella fallonii]|uniref:hypothetical protein n=1 Tax=Legionella fallonii TaxID=96230 RepID=UPI001E62B6AA|nr:hypothetical protein [Legionella fallonii]
MLDLNKCGLAEKKYVQKGRNSELITKGFIGYNWQDPEFQNATEGYSYYKYFNAGKSLYWLYTINSGGGSGTFTAIHLVKRTSPNTLDIKTLFSGDRCNGGVQDVSEANNQLTFSVNLTVYDLVTLSKKSSQSIRPYDDLAACAVCCIAKAFYTVDAKALAQLKYVELNNVKNTDELPQQGVEQSCFNKLLLSYTSAGKTTFKQSTLDEFTDKFNQMCIKTKN